MNQSLTKFELRYEFSFECNKITVLLYNMNTLYITSFTFCGENFKGKRTVNDVIRFDCSFQDIFVRVRYLLRVRYLDRNILQGYGETIQINQHQTNHS